MYDVHDVDLLITVCAKAQCSVRPYLTWEKIVFGLNTDHQTLVISQPSYSHILYMYVLLV